MAASSGENAVLRAAEVSRDELIAEVDRISASPGFVRSERLAVFCDTLPNATLRPIEIANPATGASVLDCLGDSAGSYADHDMVLFKKFRIVERLGFERQAAVNNLPNTPQWGDPRTDISNLRTFGTINSGGNPHTIRLTGRINFQP